MKTHWKSPSPGAREHRWSKRLILWAAVLTLANVLADMAIGSPMMVLPQLLEHFDTDQAAWLNASAMLAGAIWSPLLAKSSDIFGKRRILIATLLLACAGALVCLAAPNLWIFLVGRFLQGAAFAAVFLTVALARQICTAAGGDGPGRARDVRLVGRRNHRAVRDEAGHRCVRLPERVHRGGGARRGGGALRACLHPGVADPQHRPDRRERGAPARRRPRRGARLHQPRRGTSDGCPGA